METKKIILCRGIQGSGKSTAARKWCLEDPEHRVRFNNDDIRNMLGQYWVPSREDVVADIKHKFIITAMHKGYDIIVDNMNLNPKEVKFYEDLIKDWNNCSIYPSQNVNYELEFKDFFIPVEECIRRDALRPNPIGEKVIKETYKRYAHFIQTEQVKKYVNNLYKFTSMVPAIIIDMDNTLCFNMTARPWYGPGSAEGLLEDIPNEPVCELVRNYSSLGYQIILITGRDISQKEATERWLKENNVQVDLAFYRPSKDFRTGVELKKEFVVKLLTRFNIKFILEDDDKIVKMYRDLGLTVLQPN